MSTLLFLCQYTDYVWSKQKFIYVNQESGILQENYIQEHESFKINTNTKLSITFYGNFAVILHFCHTHHDPLTDAFDFDKHGKNSLWLLCKEHHL